MITTDERIAAKCRDIADFIIEKNSKYGDAYSCGVKVFSRLTPIERIDARIDEKLNRRANQRHDDDEDVDWDLVGLLINRLIQRDIAEGK